MAETVDRVTVVGAGPVGLVTALILARAGIPVLVLDAAAEISDAPRAVVYHSPTVEALGRIGLLDDLCAIGVMKQDYQWRAVDGSILAKMDMSVLRPGDTPYPYNLHLGQNDLAKVAMRHLLAFPHAEVRWGHRLVDIAQSDDTVTLGVEVEGERIALRSPWVVGSDGAGSGVRRALGLGFEGYTWDEWFVATDVVYDFEAHGYAQANFVVDPVHWAIIPKINRTGLFRVTYGEPADVPREALRDRVAAKYRVLLPDHEPVEPTAFSPYRVHDRCTERFRVGRVVLAGDAAHANNPIGGLGLTGGLLDAVALGTALAAVIHGSVPETVLDHYAQERRRVFLEVVSPTARENKRRLSESDPARQEADRERFRQLTENPDIAREYLLFTRKLVGETIVPEAA